MTAIKTHQIQDVVTQIHASFKHIHKKIQTKSIIAHDIFIRSLKLF